ncbi:DivIVA domain-containing protein [[Mycobacterium] wendilense]|uniref:Cell wall synthesis protein Wag31 n=1 Tax=[Mycobacterium] wendilense TaxID=3064284 RepID=A0ABN9P095_9MYCO|nr:DivIVA domain-containing protein [Mycolicibacterium sp. MU0050]CAJ1584021.1 DivIVA domain-containing protein [Mycolicibacterium sp. MU0050]
MDDYPSLLSSAEEVRSAVFSAPRIGRRGYNCDEVDALLDRVVNRMEGRDNLTAAEVAETRFGKPPLGKRGYREEEVDLLLDRIVRTLESMRPPSPPTAAPTRSAGGLTADDVRNATFSPPSRWRRRRDGYRESQVDDFLDAVATRLDTGRGLTAAEVRAARFDSPALGQLGYAAAEVNALLQRVAEALDSQERR